MREWLARMADRLRRDRLDAELAEELRFHRERLERDLRQAGAGPDAARDLARRRLGNPTRVREEARERWSLPALDRLEQDVGYALRGLRRAPGFTATVVVTLALGIGANAAMLDVVDRLMFRPLAHLRDPDAVHRVYWRWVDGTADRTAQSTNYTRYLDLRRWTTSFATLAAFSERELAVGEGAAARERRVGLVSASYFALFDATPALGRWFTAAEDVEPRGADVAVLSHDAWRREYGGRDVIGERLRIGEVQATIVGVAPPGFAGVDDARPPVAWLPITTFAGSGGNEDARTYHTTYRWGWVHVLARRRAGVARETAEADATLAFRRSWAAARLQEPSRAPVEAARPRALVSAVRPGGGPEPGLEARTARWLAAVAALVLVVAIANVANLSLARALRRGRETAVRVALGVGRARLARQLLTESMVLALLGGAAALLVAQWAGSAIRRLLLDAAEPAAWPAVDARVLGATAALSLAAGALVGVVPVLGALSAGRGDLARTLRGGARGGHAERTRLRAALLVVQGALSVVLLVGAALFVRSLSAVRAMPMGYDASRVLLVNRVVRGDAFDDAAQLAMRRALLAAAAAIPGVESAAWMSSAPFVSTSSTELFVPGVDSVARLGEFTFQATTPGYFRTMGTRVVRGRPLTADDRAGAPMAAVVSASMARALWPGRDPLGQCFRMRADTMPCTTVVGVAEDMVQRDVGGGARLHYYVSIEQYTRSWGNWMALRLRGDPAREAEPIRRALQRVMPGASYVTTLPLRDVVRDQQRSWRLGAALFGALGVLALLVDAVGLYGVIGYDVAQRAHELAVRVALGARRPTILRQVVGRSVRLALGGVAVGTAAALAASGRLQPLLFRQSATDPRIYLLVAAAMLLVALLAAALPAWRAARADPNAALRAE